jgi:hypothetical protein
VKVQGNAVQKGEVKRVRICATVIHTGSSYSLFLGKLSFPCFEIPVGKVLYKSASGWIINNIKFRSEGA